jgi:hypothetical protein
MLNDSSLINRTLIATILGHLTANEGKGDSIQAMKTYIWRVEGTAPLIHNLGTT